MKKIERRKLTENGKILWKISWKFFKENFVVKNLKKILQLKNFKENFPIKNFLTKNEKKIKIKFSTKNFLKKIL